MGRGDEGVVLKWGWLHKGGTQQQSGLLIAIFNLKIRWRSYYHNAEGWETWPAKVTAAIVTMNCRPQYSRHVYDVQNAHAHNRDGYTRPNGQGAGVQGPATGWAMARRPPWARWSWGATRRTYPFTRHSPGFRRRKCKAIQHPTPHSTWANKNIAYLYLILVQIIYILFSGPAHSTKTHRENGGNSKLIGKNRSTSREKVILGIFGPSPNPARKSNKSVLRRPSSSVAEECRFPCCGTGKGWVWIGDCYDMEMDE